MKLFRKAPVFYCSARACARQSRDGRGYANKDVSNVHATSSFPRKYLFPIKVSPLVRPYNQPH
ncbi:hypothetical protein KDW_36500 [Dictyobacter vulcani]|uniref:Uncharacterized protein n=1 Tax=Dictyobacter vulcani TaxID=2607529 RepID=A0A5J4KI87_9CHLR|nr:hypothetical protein [Dictyobacter vulcani]GER89488.1 hypothetical protein KDW_36500 [Dictyobacter vulcani]